ncbi:photosystem reaction center subunit H [Halobacteriales archaeon SW_5_70_135]|nr:MAG: photosystem reaction center subunit H [Halobacteriales archaeon SW_5_70_135]
MAETLARNLSNKAVMGVDGAEIGTLHNITADLKTGALNDLVVEPHEGGQSFDFERDGHDRYLVPAAHVEAMKDYVVVAR